MNSRWYVWRKPGGKLLAASATFFLLMFLCGATPIVWILEGRPNESYPELFFLFMAAPVAGALVLVALIRFLLLNRRSSNA